MKRIFLLLFLFLASCSIDEQESEGCWVFTVKTTTKVNFNGVTDYDTSVSTLSKCGLTYSEAEDAANDMECSTTIYYGEFPIGTSTITVTIKEE